jgi:hypothetical protein
VKARAIPLARSLYSGEDAAAAALALGARARVELGARGRWLVARLTPAPGEDAAALEGEFLNEALAHRCRREVRGLLGPLADAVDAAVRSEGFPPPSEDPLEQLEPAVAEDRRRDLERLGAEARRLSPR